MGKYKYCKHTIARQANHILQLQVKFGHSKHTAKVAEEHKFGERLQGIHSLRTYDKYSEIVGKFISYAESYLAAEGASKYIFLQGLKPLAEEYLREREQQGLSTYTLALEKCALQRIFRETIEYKAPPRAEAEITRSRGEAARDKHFSEEKNRDLVEVARCTGGRREDLSRLQRKDFFEREGRLFVKFEQSKGGRDRISLVLHPERIREILDRRTKDPEDRIFEKIHSGADIHSYRREYAQALYQELLKHPQLKQQLQEAYRLTATEKEYICRDGSRERYDKDSMSIVSQSLGHNRADTTIKSYVKK